jgi:hypothetical protein
MEVKRVLRRLRINDIYKNLTVVRSNPPPFRRSFESIGNALPKCTIDLRPVLEKLNLGGAQSSSAELWSFGY